MGMPEQAQCDRTLCPAWTTKLFRVSLEGALSLPTLSHRPASEREKEAVPVVPKVEEPLSCPRPFLNSTSLPRSLSCLAANLLRVYHVPLNITLFYPRESATICAASVRTQDDVWSHLPSQQSTNCTTLIYFAAFSDIDSCP